MKKILILNGPNLNLLGNREPDVYGNNDISDLKTYISKSFPEVEFTYFQSNHEGELIDKIQETEGKFIGIVFNPGGYSHTSVAILDAIRSVSTPLIEVHISNPHSREDYRKQMITATAARGLISGFGFDSYKFGVQALLSESFRQ